MKKLIRYGLNGVVNTAVSYGLFLYLASVIDYRPAVVVSYLTGMLSSYIMNGAFVFGTRGHLPLFITVNLSLMLVNLSITWSLVERLAQPKALAQIIAIGIIFLLGFAINGRFVFVIDAQSSVDLPPGGSGVSAEGCLGRSVDAPKNSPNRGAWILKR